MKSGFVNNPHTLCAESMRRAASLAEVCEERTPALLSNEAHTPGPIERGFKMCSVNKQRVSKQRPLDGVSSGITFKWNVGENDEVLTGPPHGLGAH